LKVFTTTLSLSVTMESSFICGVGGVCFKLL
jgi:hypothetical protein